MSSQSIELSVFALMSTLGTVDRCSPGAKATLLYINDDLHEKEVPTDIISRTFFPRPKKAVKLGPAWLTALINTENK